MNEFDVVARILINAVGNEEGLGKSKTKETNVLKESIFLIAKNHPTKNKRVLCPWCGKSNYRPKVGDKCYHCGNPFGVER